MSLTVPADLLEQAASGEVDDEQFVACVHVAALCVVGDQRPGRLPSSGDGFADKVP